MKRSGCCLNDFQDVDRSFSCLLKAFANNVQILSLLATACACLSLLLRSRALRFYVPTGLQDTKARACTLRYLMMVKIGLFSWSRPRCKGPEERLRCNTLYHCVYREELATAASLELDLASSGYVRIDIMRMKKVSYGTSHSKSKMGCHFSSIT
jgi:hypothetical protein